MARAKGGEFVLRIEDTDRERSTEASVQAIHDGMAWLGLSADRPVEYQTQRMARYKALIEQMLDRGQAYYCYCSKEELDALREEQRAKGLKPRYDGRYRDFTGTPPAGVTPVIRFKNPLEGDVGFDDAVHGRIRVANSELDDLVIARGDGMPTYNFAVVVDDMDMGITDVIRGDDHINNTPRQINIYRALGGEPPRFAHVPMILGSDGARLSKRHGAVSVMQYREDGYLPQALLNYLVRLGWSHGDQEIFSMQEMIDLFRIEDVNKAAASFNTEKLRWLNSHYLRTLAPETIAPELGYHMQRAGLDVGQGPSFADLLTVQKERFDTLDALVEDSRIFYADIDGFDEKAAKKHLRPVAREPLEHLKQMLGDVADEAWCAETLSDVVKQVAEALSLGMGKVGMPLRVALSGSGQSPDIGATLWLLGKHRSIQRVDQALGFIAQREQAAQA
jgi:glutamyl-tRNA synthetase